ncbi:MAG TPA: ROK family protein [Propionibacteriaceae bacterium]|nr:ROK family protein [Propionibacteriaceae bacterium]
MSSGPNSAGELLQLFRTGSVATRSELQRVTGLARSTVTYKLDALLAAGYLVEDGSIVDGRGRPSTRLRINDQVTTILVADLGATHGRLAVATPAGDVLIESVIESNIGKGPDAVLPMVTRKLDQLLKRSGRTRSSLRGAAIGVPGPVNWQSGRIARSISMPGWDNYPVQDHLAEYFRVPTVVDNDANLMGLGEQRRIYPNAHQVLFIKVGTGIGASVIIDGELLRGTDSAEGDIGHAKITGVEETCSSCGARGCLAAIASGRAMVRDLRRLGHEPATMRDVVQLVRAGNPDAVRVVTAAGRALGDVLSTAVSLLNPDVVAIGGDAVHAHERLLLGVRETLLARSQPLATARLAIAPSALADRAGIMGGAAMVADVIFGSAAVDAKIT